MFGTNPFGGLKDEESSDQISFDRDNCLQEHKNEMRQKYELFSKHVSDREYLTKSTINRFLEIILDCSLKINQNISVIEEEGLDSDPMLYFEMDRETNQFYKLMDQKYQKSICTMDAMSAFHRYDFLLDIDVYYNFWAVTKNKEYISFIFNQSSKEMLGIVDLIYFKDDKVNRKSRDKIYKEILEI